MFVGKKLAGQPSHTAHFGVIQTADGEMIDEVLQPQGVAVVVEGSHMCSMMRGVKKEHPRMMTSYMIGKYKEDKDLRREFMDQLRK